MEEWAKEWVKVRAKERISRSLNQMEGDLQLITLHRRALPDRLLGGQLAEGNRFWLYHTFVLDVTRYANHDCALAAKIGVQLDESAVAPFLCRIGDV